MDFVPLSSDQRRAFAEDGFLVVPNALDGETVERLVSEADRLADAFLRKPLIACKPEYNHLDLRRGLLKQKGLFALVSHSVTVPLVVQLLGTNIQLHSTTIIYKRPEAPDAPSFRRGWHRDIRMARDLGHDRLPLAGIKVCYCLTDFLEADSGMTLFARGTHLRAEPLRIPKGAIDPLDVEVCDLKLKAGDAVFFEHRLFHTAAPNRSERTSKVVIYGYAYRWMRPEVYLESPDERQLMHTDPITRQLLGGYRDVDTPPWALERWAKKHGVTRETFSWTTQV
ncbi:MAG TPA: phytanoyl-CoA dioxygenase family protein [Pyrinomonadaceae bacterium]|jgi:ectoine hydroxylase-related dioxygenase (phytanoyl-CoA dioxygenase family)|nr:phytanoyl-CoA dioxygenase family protein [Pyrinomonadaceae bacterium]